MRDVITIKAFKAVNDPGASVKFQNEHIKILNSYGLTNLSSSNEKWMMDENVYVIVCELQSTKKILGGLRVHAKSFNNLLPIEEALQELNYTINEQNINVSNSGELCAFWICRDDRYITNLNKIIVNAAITLSYLLGIDTLIIFGSPHTRKIALDAGFEYDPFNNRSFLYPTKNYSTDILFHKNTLQKNYKEKEKS